MKRLEYAVKWAVCMLALSLVGCASALTTAQKTVSAAATLGSAAGTLAAQIDASKEEAIVEQLYKDHNVTAAEAARDAWHAQRAHISEALKTYDATVVAAGAAVTLAGAKLDLPTLLVTLGSAYTSLSGALASYGITLPKAGL